ncbi:DUF397 domain-containing protein [Streptomyces sp. NPDC003374]
MRAGSPSSQVLRWFKSSYSGGNATECVEAAVVPSGVLIRDSKRPGDLHIGISAEAWHSFLGWRAPRTPC